MKKMSWTASFFLSLPILLTHANGAGQLFVTADISCSFAQVMGSLYTQLNKKHFLLLLLLQRRVVLCLSARKRSCACSQMGAAPPPEITMKKVCVCV